ncbi:MAG: urea carboxylase [Planctomycetota bacterium]|jgi:urea carboxylase|nr:urea carboxylase [Planctomycetota bacterium]
MFSKVLIANRGAIACRIIRTLRAMGVASVAVYSDADRHARHVELADEAVRIGPPPVAESYLSIDAILAAAKQTGAEAIHPGYGFLSENPDFATACAEAGVVFIGPTPEQMIAFGLKHEARALAEALGVPLVPGSALLQDETAAVTAADAIGYPVMLKATAGGGGIGMRVCASQAELREAFAAVKRLAGGNFGHDGVFVEKYIERARHLEVQVVGDGLGGVVALGERDCSVQRRNQKVIEESPAPGLSPARRSELIDAAVKMTRAVRYRNAGTVEFVYDVSADAFYFLEVNCRLQVEHGVTEMVTGVDLVAWMLHIAAGDTACLSSYDHAPQGHAIQARVYAEDPARDFQPAAGLVTRFATPEGVRCDHCLADGIDVPAFYDPLIAKIIVHTADRESARKQLRDTLSNLELHGIEANHTWLAHVLEQDVFTAGEHHTRWLADVPWQPLSIDVLRPGTHSSVQDWPGREGYWDVGVPPSGPMDDLSFRVGNRLLGNDEAAAALELTMSGPRLRFNAPGAFCLTGARMSATLDGEEVPQWTVVHAAAGAVLDLGTVQDAACRTYLCVAGGIDVPPYLGSRSTFDLGEFGGHGGRVLRTGDVLRLGACAALPPIQSAPEQLQPHYGHHWDVGVLYGPHGAPDFFTDEDIDAIFAADWSVHYNSNRTGVRLIGPKPTWARSDGGEAGLHPSNIHDNAYAVGTIDFTGDMPVILGRDGPSLGGFVCPATVVAADFWKIGQVRPGDTIRFHRLSQDQAVALERDQDAAIAALGSLPPTPTVITAPIAEDSPILARREDGPDGQSVTVRRAGDRYLLVEYGDNILDINLRMRAHTLQQALAADRPAALREMVPGIRSLQLRYDPQQLDQQDLVDHVMGLQNHLPSVDEVVIPSRIVHLPLSWDDPATREAIEKYQKSVRPDAPWCPSNIEFIRRINGLDDEEAVRKVLFGANYLVLGLGDVYLGAPVATPVDPRHRLVTTKYNPARTWTAPNSVGIGGAYLCIYGMEGPGGYQFVGRTCQVWNTYRETKRFTPGHPWLLRFFDQIRWHEVSHDELMEFRQDFLHGKVDIKVEETTFDLGAYNRFLRDEADSIADWKNHQQASFEAERQRWIDQGLATYVSEIPDVPAEDSNTAIPDGAIGVDTPIPGSVWQLPVSIGDEVGEGDALVVIEAMKMETRIDAPCAGRVVDIRCREGAPVNAGQCLVVLESVESGVSPLV